MDTAGPVTDCRPDVKHPTPHVLLTTIASIGHHHRLPRIDRVPCGRGEHQHGQVDRERGNTQDRDRGRDNIPNLDRVNSRAGHGLDPSQSLRNADRDRGRGILQNHDRVNDLSQILRSDETNKIQ